MSEDTVAVVVTVTFFVVMAAWIPLVKCFGRTMQRPPEREQRKSNPRVVAIKPQPRAKKDRGYETAITITMIVAVCSLGMFN